MPHPPQRSPDSPERTLLLLVGSLLTLLGCFQPWGSVPLEGTPLRAIDTSIGLPLWGAALLMILVTVIQPHRQRAIMITLSSAAGYWLLLWPLQSQGAISRGWWTALVGSAMCLLVVLAPPAWWRL